MSTSAPINWDALPPTLSVEEAGDMCGIGRDAAYQAVHLGQLPCLKFGQRKFRVPTQALRTLLETGSLPVPPLAIVRGGRAA